MGDTGESTLKALIYFYHNYKIVSEYIEYIPPTPSPVETSLTGLLSQLEADTVSGILMINSHGDTGGWLAVEAYEYSEQGRISLQNQINFYITNTGIPSREIDIGEEKDKYYALLISANYIKNHTSRMCNKSIVFGSFCYSLDFADAFIGGGKVYNFYGFNEAVTIADSFYCMNTVIERLGGALDEKRNYTVSQAMIGLPDFFSLTSKDDPARSETIYNSPKILQLKITQGNETVYDYSYDDLIYPFLDTPYPNDTGDLSRYKGKNAIAGELRIRIRFSETMDWGAYQLQIRFDPQGETEGASWIPFTDGEWSKTLYEYDTWEGTGFIPSMKDGIDGMATVIVKARDAFQGDASSGNADGELDTDGDGIFNGKDTQHKFEIKRMLVQSLDNTNTPKREFTEDEDIYIGGKNFPFIPNASYNAYIREHNEWAEGENIERIENGELRIENYKSG